MFLDLSSRRPNDHVHPLGAQVNVVVFLSDNGGGVIMSESVASWVRPRMRRLRGVIGAFCSAVGIRRPKVQPQAPASSRPITARELQEHALRCLPLGVRDLTIDPNGIEFVGFVAAPYGLTEDMKFFINGQPFDEVEFPILDSDLQTIFSAVPWAPARVRARVTTNLHSLRSASFFRIDASPTGAFVPCNWRQAFSIPNPERERYAFPPAANMRRVIGDDSPVRFALGGSTTFHNIGAYLAEMGRRWSDFPRILDWGCGAGRVTRYLLTETQAEVHGVDIDPENIAWCKSELTTGNFDCISPVPPTTFPDQYFDLIIGCSVFTHLSEEMQMQWLAELQRIARPNALLFLSVQGPTQFAYNRLPLALFHNIEEKGFVDYQHDPSLDTVIDDSTYYRSAFQSRRYIVDSWSQFFQVVSIVDAIAALQDFVVLRRR
jgi:SAM-dependent methyltransferase